MAFHLPKFQNIDSMIIIANVTLAVPNNFYWVSKNINVYQYYWTATAPAVIIVTVQEMIFVTGPLMIFSRWQAELLIRYTGSTVFHAQNLTADCFIVINEEDF